MVLVRKSGMPPDSDDTVGCCHSKGDVLCCSVRPSGSVDKGSDAGCAVDKGKELCGSAGVPYSDDALRSLWAQVGLSLSVHAGLDADRVCGWVTRELCGVC